MRIEWTPAMEHHAKYLKLSWLDKLILFTCSRWLLGNFDLIKNGRKYSCQTMVRENKKGREFYLRIYGVQEVEHC